MNVLSVGESGESEVALARRAEAGAGGADDVGVLEKVVKEVPAGGAIGGLHPYVGGVLAAIDLIAHVGKVSANEAGISHVVVD